MVSLVEIRVPSESFEGTRAQLLRWLKPVGAAVIAGEPLAEVETDKVTVEIAAAVSGTLREICKQATEEIAVGDLLGRIESDGATAVESVAATPAPPPAVRSADPPPPAAASAVSPAVRRLLVQHGLEATAVQGSGGGGRVTVEDVLRHVVGRGLEPAAGATGVRRVPHSATRRLIAERMVASLLHTAPHVTTVFEVDLGKVLAHRARQRAALERQGVPLTLTAYFVAACVPAIRAVPEVNARWTDAALEIFETIDVGIATAVEGKGLVVPVLRDVARLGLVDIAAELGRLTGRARADSLTPADVRGGTFTLSNHGVSGSLVAAPVIINQPQSAILGVGKLEQRAVVVSQDGVDAIVARPRCYVTLTLDHRVLDGHQANRFLATWAAAVEGWADR